MNAPATVTRDEQIVLLTEVRGVGQCRACGSQVTWAVTIAGAMMPLEPELRVRALLQPSMRRRHTARVCFRTGPDRKTLVAKDAKHEASLVTKGFSVREELYEVWEMPASLTHWPHCKRSGR